MAAPGERFTLRTAERERRCGLLARFRGRMKQWCAFAEAGFLCFCRMRRREVGKVQLSGSEKRALILWVLAGMVGLWYAQRNFFAAFPEASISFKVTRAEAL